MLISFRDRFRPFYGSGAKRISVEAILPIILLPIMFGIAAINLYCTIFICVTIPLFLGYAQYLRKSIAPRTKFFFLWALWSVIYLWILFEMTVPLLELLPEENFIFISTMFLSMFCFYKTKQRAPLNFVAQNIDSEDKSSNSNQTRLLMDDIECDNDKNDNSNDDEDNDESESDGCDFRMSRMINTCPKCRKYIPPRAFHCTICQQCIAKRDHHSVWLDCCIGETNHRLFLAGCGLGVFALLFGANLSMTSICHPFFVFKLFGINVLMPDDCSDVFDQYDIALCFVGSIYATVMAICCIILLIQQFYLIVIGVTASEWSRGDISRHGCLTNFKTFICCSR